MPEKLQQKLDASVIIPSFGQKNYISKVLESLYDQNTEYDYEIIVVESSGDGTAELVREKFPSVRVIELEKRTFPGTARNFGIKAAQSDILLFTDTDCVVDRNWIQQMVAGQRQGKRALAGLVRNGTNKNIIGIADYLLEFYEFLSLKPQIRPAPIATCNVSYHRDLFEKYGFFEDHVKGSDSIFSRKIDSEGELIYCQPKIQIWHHNRTNIKKVIKNQFELGYGAALSRRKYTLQGQVFVKFRFLIPLMPILRSAKIACKILRNSPANFFKFLLVFPFIFMGLIAHAVGFTRGLSAEI